MPVILNSPHNRVNALSGALAGGWGEDCYSIRDILNLSPRGVDSSLIF